jgi:hypothetical protein
MHVGVSCRRLWKGALVVPGLVNETSVRSHSLGEWAHVEDTTIIYPGEESGEANGDG